MTDDDLIKPWLAEYERKALAMQGDSFGVAGVSKDLQIIAALRRLLEDRDKYKAFAQWLGGLCVEHGILKDLKDQPGDTVKIELQAGNGDRA